MCIGGSQSKLYALWRKRPVETTDRVQSPKRSHQSDSGLAWLYPCSCVVLVPLLPLHIFHSTTWLKVFFRPFCQIWWVGSPTFGCGSSDFGLRSNIGSSCSRASTFRGLEGSFLQNDPCPPLRGVPGWGDAHSKHSWYFLQKYVLSSVEGSPYMGNMTIKFSGWWRLNCMGQFSWWFAV